ALGPVAHRRRARGCRRARGPDERGLRAGTGRTRGGRALRGEHEPGGPL
ncbi:MAG: pyridoxal-phosphate dependent enzyme family protein, partial [uncultured Nocardioidaceae bacterium]